MKWISIKEKSPPKINVPYLIYHCGEFFIGTFSFGNELCQDYWFLRHWGNQTQFSYPVACEQDDYWCELEAPVRKNNES